MLRICCGHYLATAVFYRTITEQPLLCSCLFRGRCLATGLHVTLSFIVAVLLLLERGNIYTLISGTPVFRIRVLHIGLLYNIGSYNSNSTGCSERRLIGHSFYRRNFSLHHFSRKNAAARHHVLRSQISLHNGHCVYWTIKIPPRGTTYWEVW
jgi:hypothetical protein